MVLRRVTGFASTSGSWCKQADRYWPILKATSTHLTIRTGAGQDLSLAFHSRLFRLPYQVPFPRQQPGARGS